MYRHREQNTEGQAKCRRCGNYWPTGDFSVEPNSKILMCSVCLKELSEGVVKKEDTKKEVKEIIERVDDEKVRKKCRYCDYVFNYNKLDKTPVMCPYCNTKI